jgi:hypothetical protein
MTLTEAASESSVPPGDKVDKVVDVLDPRFPLPEPPRLAAAAPTAAAPPANTASPIPARVGLAEAEYVPRGGGGGNVPNIIGDPPSGLDNALLSDEDELSTRRPRLGGVTSGDEMTPPPG